MRGLLIFWCVDKVGDSDASEKDVSRMLQKPDYSIQYNTHPIEKSRDSTHQSSSSPVVFISIGISHLGSRPELAWKDSLQTPGQSLIKPQIVKQLTGHSVQTLNTFEMTLLFDLWIVDSNVLEMM